MDEPADFEEWYRRSHGPLVSSMLVICGDVADAAEVADEAFSRALERWDRVGRMTSPTGWTYEVAVNCARRRFRRRSMEQRLLRRDPGRRMVDGPAGEAWLLVRDLPPRQRTAVVLRHIAQLTEPEIATAMGVGRSTVSSTLHAAYSSLALAITLDPEVDRA
jgi:RNA polymerase sigma-70 factor (ECF subfamily)